MNKRSSALTSMLKIHVSIEFLMNPCILDYEKHFEKVDARRHIIFSSAIDYGAVETLSFSTSTEPHKAFRTSYNIPTHCNYPSM